MGLLKNPLLGALDGRLGVEGSKFTVEFSRRFPVEAGNDNGNGDKGGFFNGPTVPFYVIKFNGRKLN